MEARSPSGIRGPRLADGFSPRSPMRWRVATHAMDSSACARQAPWQGLFFSLGSEEIVRKDISMDKIKPLFTATATAIGGRNGHTETSDGIVKADLSLPKEMGGPGKPGTATPEHLFAAGYAACFGGALDFVAKQKKRDAANAKI